MSDDCYKIPYESRKDADRAVKKQAREMRARRANRRRQTPQRSYLCGCGKWHITSSPQK